MANNKILKHVNFLTVPILPIFGANIFNYLNIVDQHIRTSELFMICNHYFEKKKYNNIIKYKYEKCVSYLSFFIGYVDMLRKVLKKFCAGQA